VVLLLALAGLQSLVPIPVVFFGANAVTWSISTEAVFYVLFPWLQRQVQLRPWRVLLLVLGIGLALAVLAIALRLPGFAADRLQQPVWEGLVYVNPLARLAEFLVGLLAARWYLAGVLQARLQQLAWPQSLWVVTLLELLALALLALAPKLLQNSPLLAALAPPLQLVFLQWVYGLCFASLILVVALQAGLFSRLLTLKAFVFLGEISYLYHQIVMLRLIQGPKVSLAGYLLPRPGFVEVLGLSLLLAGLSWWLVERRCLLWLRPAGAPRE
jgi:peptidoglycan/LPS O-acetylase OafA/YrhL